MTFEELWPAIEPITGYLFKEEAQVLYDLSLLTPENGTLVELGCYCGRSSRIFAEIAKEKRAKLYCVDMFKSNFDATPLEGLEAKRQFTANILTPFYDYVELIISDTSMAEKLFTGREVDFLFIDADHTAEGVKADCEAWLPRLKSGSIVAFHDYRGDLHPGVKEGAEPFVSGWHNVCNEFSVAAFKKP